MLDETALRKPEWVEGVPMTLGDGQVWHVPKPVLFARPTKFRRQFEGGEGEARTLGRPVALDGDPYFGKLQLMMESSSEPGEFRLSVAFDLFLDLIGVNYALDATQAAELLPVIIDAEGEQDEANADLWRAVLGVAMGQGEGLPADGIASSA